MKNFNFGTTTTTTTTTKSHVCFVNADISYSFVARHFELHKYRNESSRYVFQKPLKSFKTNNYVYIYRGKISHGDKGPGRQKNIISRASRRGKPQNLERGGVEITK